MDPAAAVDRPCVGQPVVDPPQAARQTRARREKPLFPLIDTAPRAARPLITLGLIAANTLVFLWMLSLPPRALQSVLVHAALIPARYTEPELARAAGLDPSNWWPLLTNAFLHGGWLHLISNMWFLWIFGPAMEARFTRLGFFVLYIAGALAASGVHLAAHPESTEPVLGASGAIAAVIGTTEEEDASAGEALAVRPGNRCVVRVSAYAGISRSASASTSQNRPNVSRSSPRRMPSTTSPLTGQPARITSPARMAMTPDRTSIQPPTGHSRYASAKRSTPETSSTAAMNSVKAAEVASGFAISHSPPM